jgi:hypothetical protein
VNAGEILRARGLDTEELRAVLHPVDVERVQVRPAPGVLLRVWERGTGAITLIRRIYVHPDLLADDHPAMGRLIVHELVHVRQWSDYGPIPFLRRYLGEYLAGRRKGIGHRMAYWSNPLEAEARSIAERFG